MWGIFEMQQKTETADEKIADEKITNERVEYKRVAEILWARFRLEWPSLWRRTTFLAATAELYQL